MNVGQICSRRVDLVEPSESVAVAAQRMLQRDVGSLVVRDADGEPIGIVTDRDLTVKVLANGLDGAAVTVGEIMSRSPYRVVEDAEPDAALSIMRQAGLRRLPVVDIEGRLIGLVALDDLLVRVADDFAMIRAIVERAAPRGSR